MRVIYNKPKNKNELPIKPITCPRCKSKEIAIIPEAHKAIICRILKYIFFLCMLYQIFPTVSAIFEQTYTETNGFAVIIFAFFSLVFEIAQLYIESKTYIQCVCRDCGNYWIHND